MSNLRKPEFPLFPHKLWRPNPAFLQGSVGKKDPWARRDDWRYHEMFSAKNRLKRAFPGLAYGAFFLTLYITYDQWYTRSGPGKAEREKWENWTEERNERLKHAH